ncbi:hypothetical protein CYPRO_0274 [Cyclonatronum proteinivorum]|uniref:Nuclear transport factor 2 family protein n=1 Tax=Cyclonatronum proteinivorum TaxID=1457365 RepID=A0A345UGG0_9BACT|nr:hypothetical protein [Cyclonatronum proteinivorum]AXI99561.1 hypothetical protein CYPRO_0274 [Cyclonatronum proteinivorum]
MSSSIRLRHLPLHVTSIRTLVFFLFLGMMVFQPITQVLAASDDSADPPTEIRVNVADFTDSVFRAVVERNATAFLTEINRAYSLQRRPNFGAETSGTFDAVGMGRLWSVSPFYVYDDIIIEQLARRSDGSWEMRNLPLMLRDADGAEHYEEGVLEFEADGQVRGLRLALPAHRYQELIRAADSSVDHENRMMIISFLEIFRTAFNQKDITFIEQVFSDEALIIVGRVVENTGRSSEYEQQVEFLRFNKEEYISRLRNVFARNAWIDVGFEEIDIFRHPRHPHMYGVSLVQFYNSEIYSDVGYLFLLIDFSADEEPLIHVRTWQPKQATPESNRFSMGDIEVF